MSTGLEELGIVDDELEEMPKQAVPEALPRVGAGTPDPDAEAQVEQLAQTLGQIALLSGLLPIHLRRIAHLVQDLSFRRGEHVFSHGDPGDGLYLILDGAIRISRQVPGMGEEALTVLRPGQYFGEMCIVDDDAPRSADAIAHEDSTLLRLPKDDLRDLMFVDRELAYELLWRFVRTLSARLRESNDRLLMLTVSSKF